MIRKDSLGREWQLVEARPRPTYGPEFGYEPKECVSLGPLSPLAADCFHESMMIGGIMTAAIRAIKMRVAANAIERIRQAGMRIELAGPSFAVKTFGKKLLDDDAKLLTILKPEIIRLLDRCSCRC